MDKPVLFVSKAAASDLSTKQYYAVKLDGSGLLAVCGAEDTAFLGILNDNPNAANVIGLVMLEGLSTAIYGGTVAAGDRLMTDSSGKLVVAKGNAPVVAVAIDAGVSGDWGTVCVGGKAGKVQGAKVISFNCDLADITAATIATLTPGFAGRIQKVTANVNKAATTAAKAATVTPKIDTVALTGGVLSLTSANMTPLGNEVAGTAVTALNTFTSTGVITLVASAVTAFVEGRVQFNLYCD